ncbi:hypothetical protein sscle_15g103200 [Sclerotinia sclerotiorum 1980 UF-70]|uniref:HECT-type E3 ubiquitin transferase n=1 Tax=Sclerotinia sclerotiorum (strain ATCC 18683 / 1980 / Ss-1) TaxID=665079 RepID=A0A1D9QKT5_SCLS1|nr:hypothetical protein sscle_15g103200 [Sclerotinia sclerotiorum 1980 UF-70]
MTRDTPRIQEERSFSGEDDILKALWVAAPFPYLPQDAPDELKKLTIDVEDPKQLHVIHNASRRHHFQLMVERYIRQLRYGCDSTICHTPTCFTCRKRLSLTAGRPIRPYSSTSARILAVHLASQDNPERGLCRNPLADSPVQLNKHVRVTARRNISGPKKIHVSGGETTKRSTPSTDNERFRPDPSRACSTATTSGTRSFRDNVASNEDSSGQSRKSRTTILEEYTTTDHKSFIQNVFGTVAFKMVEWLTPRNLEALANPNDTALDSDVRSSSLAQSTPSDGASTPAQKLESPSAVETELSSNKSFLPKSSEVSAEISGVPDRTVRNEESTGADATDISTRREISPNLSPTIPTDTKPGIQSSPKVLHNESAHVAGGRPRRRTDSYDAHISKGILNLSTSPRTTDTDTSPPLSHQYIHSKPKPTRHTMITKPVLHVSEKDTPSPITPVISASVKPSVPAEPESDLKSDSEDNAAKNSSVECQKLEPRLSDEKLPQSLSSLPIEVVNLICDILENDKTFEKHQLHPDHIDDDLKRHQVHKTPLHRNINSSSGYPKSMKNQWRRFIDQSLYSVLSSPDSLIKSFTGRDGQIFDTQTIWYCMLRMTRVAPSIVFDSLWIAAGTLFKPPKQLEWAKQPHSDSSGSNQSLSKADAAQIISICFHALVAAAPLLKDPRQLANMSRIRSYGIALPGRESSTSESARLCLQYDDAFTDELALRLARRVFSAVSTRRRFSQLIQLQQDIRGDENEQDGFLEIILDSLKYLDLDKSPLLNFTDVERDLHEKRIPTLILDWARTVMLQDWDGKAEVPSDGSFGGALETIATIYRNRKSLLLGDIHFRTEYFSDRLDSIAMPLEWLSFQANKRTVHLLDYPYLFNPSTLVNYFRAINYSRMNQSHEEAKSMYNLVRTHEGLIPNEDHRRKLRERLHTATSRFLVIVVSRENLLSDAFNVLWRREERELMRPLKVSLGGEIGEEGVDMGGVQQEFFRIAMTEALNPDYGVFTIDGTTKMTWFQPGSPEPLWKFELIGTIMSLAVYNGMTLPITFPKAFYRKLQGESITELHHISDGWPELAKGLTDLLEWDENKGAVEDIFCRTYEFSQFQFGKPVSREMSTSSQWPKYSDVNIGESNEDPGEVEAPLVTNENRNNYVSDYINWLTNISIQPQFEAFKKGFFACLDPRSISIFDSDTLQSLVEGVQEIDIVEMQRGTQYIGYEAGDRVIQDFWSVVKEYDLEKKKKLLEFTTASDRVPMGGMRNFQLRIMKNGATDEQLPSSYTCFQNLLLPNYSSRQILKERFDIALEHSKGFGFN